MAEVLVVYYSRSGLTQRVAKAIAQAGHWTLEEIVDERSKKGFRGWLRANLDARFRRKAKISAPQNNPADFDLVILGSPVVTHSVAAPVRAWLTRERGQLHALALFVTERGHGSRQVLDQMAELAALTPVGELVLRERGLPSNDLPQRVMRFVVALEHVMLRREPSFTH